MDLLGFVLAGGEGKRLYPLTKDRAKPAVPYEYRQARGRESYFVSESGIVIVPQGQPKKSWSFAA